MLLMTHIKCVEIFPNSNNSYKGKVPVQKEMIVRSTGAWYYPQKKVKLTISVRVQINEFSVVYETTEWFLLALDELVGHSII